MVFILLGCQSVMCQVEMNYELLNYMAAKEPDPDPEDRQEIKKQFKTYFIKQVFLNSVFILRNADESRFSGLF